jgi:hypothetical protein
MRTNAPYAKRPPQGIDKPQRFFIRAHTHQTTSAQVEQLLLNGLNEFFIGANNTATTRTHAIFCDDSPFDKAVSTIELKNHHSTSN